MSRSGMTAIIEELRTMTEAGTAEYTVGTTSYWSDNALQDVLDLYRNNLTHYPTQWNPIVVSGGTLQYYDLALGYGFFEATTGGTSIFYLQDSTGTKLGTALYSTDYRLGRVTFTSDALGSTIYTTGRHYDLNAAAANVWRKKAAHYAPTSFSFSTDNHTIRRDQVYDHCLQMAAYFDGQSSSSIQTVSMFRGDME